MKHLKASANLDRIDGTVGVCSIITDNLEYARLNASHWLGRGRRLSGLRQVERMPDIFADLVGKPQYLLSTISNPPDFSEGYSLTLHT